MDRAQCAMAIDQHQQTKFYVEDFFTDMISYIDNINIDNRIKYHQHRKAVIWFRDLQTVIRSYFTINTFDSLRLFINVLNNVYDMGNKIKQIIASKLEYSQMPARVYTILNLVKIHIQRLLMFIIHIEKRLLYMNNTIIKNAEKLAVYKQIECYPVTVGPEIYEFVAFPINNSIDLLDVFYSTSDSYIHEILFYHNMEILKDILL